MRTHGHHRMCGSHGNPRGRFAIVGFALVVAVAPAGSPARAGQQPLVEQALDEPTEITLESVPLGEAIRTISQRTGVKIVMSPEVMALVPNGAATIVQRVEIANVSLRQGLTEFLAPLGMTFEVRGKHVVVLPEPALQCLGRAATWDELDALARLRTLRPGVNRADLDRLREMVQFQVPEPDGWAVLAGAMGAVGAGTGEELLSIACENLGWAWCLSGPGVVITSFEQQIRHRLQRPISFRMNYVPLIDVLTEIGRRAGVAVHTEPGALASLPMYLQKNFSLNVHQTPAEQVLEKIVAATGLAYRIQPDGVFFSLSGEPPAQLEALAQEQPAQPGRDPYVGKIVVELEDGRTVEWFIRSSELPPDLRRRRQEDLQAAFDALRKRADRSSVPKPR